ncbi:hypothetical protein VNI00_015731 [Paramarasmius palmivorus]|uniref:Uncharacterized protein n=1 Tax=Paramarasmius palmivorus TaxID=297713 RepID=A0AAW0BIZ6_9AGAR
MSKEECRRWRIPELGKPLDWSDLELLSWPTDVYTALRKWQVARGFDPSTADWARSCGYPELEIIGGKEEEARFEGVHDWYSYLIKLREQAVELQLCTSVQVQRPLPTRRYSWPTNVYTSLRNQQVARGFEHTTSNWTQCLMSLEFEIIGTNKEAQFEEVQEYASYLREWHAELQMLKSPAQETDTIPELDETSRSCLNGCFRSPGNTSGASSSDEQGNLPPPEQNKPLSAQLEG